MYIPRPGIEQELAWFSERLPFLRETWEGQYAVVKGRCITIRPTIQEALEFGYEQYGLDPFAVCAICEPKIATFTRDL